MRLLFAIGGLLLMLLTAGLGAWSISRSPAPSARPATRAYDFYSKFGVNGNLNSGGSINNELADMTYLGVRNIRESIFNEGYAASFAKLAAAGVKLHLDFQSWTTPAPSMSDWLGWLKNHIVLPYPASVVGLSGPNEVDHTGPAFVYDGRSGIPAANQAQRDLYNGIKADPVLKNIPVDMWPLAFGKASAVKVGDMTAYCDRANMHDYYPADNRSLHFFPWAGDMQVGIQGYLRNYRLVCNRAAFVTTETGWYTPWRKGWNSSGTNEYVQARLLLNDLFDHAMLADCKAVYIFTLRWGSADFSDPGWGVFRDDGTPKEAAKAVRNTMAILKDNGANAASFTPSPLAYTLSGMPTAAGNFIVQKSDRAYDLILWNETPLWSITTGAQLAIPSSTVTISLPNGASGEVYDPVKAADPIKTFRNAKQLRVYLNDAPLIIEIRQTKRV